MKQDGVEEREKSRNRERLLVAASLLVTIVYSSPLDNDVLSIARRQSIISGKRSYSSACANSSHWRKPLKTYV